MGTEDAIFATGTLASPLTGLVVKDCYIHDWGYTGIRLDFCNEFFADDNRIEDCYRNGIETRSCNRGSTCRNTIKNITGPSGSYGITHTKSSGTEATFPVPTEIVCNDNVIHGVVNWEGLDTHGGRRMVFSGNTVTEDFV